MAQSFRPDIEGLTLSNQSKTRIPTGRIRPHTAKVRGSSTRAGFSSTMRNLESDP